MDPQNTHEKKCWTHKISTGKSLIATKYPRETIWDLQNTHEEKFETHEILPRKNWDPRNTVEKKFRTHEDRIAPWHETDECYAPICNNCPNL